MGKSNSKGKVGTEVHLIYLFRLAAVCRPMSMPASANEVPLPSAGLTAISPCTVWRGILGILGQVGRRSSQCRGHQTADNGRHRFRSNQGNLGSERRYTLSTHSLSTFPLKRNALYCAFSHCVVLPQDKKTHISDFPPLENHA